MTITSCSRCGVAHPDATPCRIAANLPLPPSVAPLAPGTRVAGRFRIDAVAHRSGMSTVYRATDLRNQEIPVALKELAAGALPAAERAEALAWMAREAGLLSTLHHPRLPRLLAAFSEGDRHYLAMPFLAGRTLEALVARHGPQPETLVLGWAHSLANLLTYLHNQDPPIIHRDLKPANVLIGPDGSATLLDLGVARPLARGVTGTAMGTPGYAPPEQYQGLADERSDLYALGATMHRALTGFDAEHAPPFRQPAVRDVNPRLSQWSASIVAALLQLAPAARPDDAARTAKALALALRRGRCAPLIRAYMQILALLLVAVLAGGGLYRWLFGHAATQRIYGVDYMPGRGALDPIRVLLVFAPALLCFVPLLLPGMRRLCRDDAALRSFRTRALWLLALGWLAPVALWLADLRLFAAPGNVPDSFGLAEYPSHLIAVPGRLPMTIPLALAAAGLVAARLLRRYWSLRRLQVHAVRLRPRHIALRLTGLLVLWLLILFVQLISARPSW